MDKYRQIVASPTDLGGKGVLVLNDVDLIIPATQIEVNKEDLTYRYRTLRTKASTKVPTGNGQVSIHMSIPFTDDTILSMHRLLVEMRNSPFMYVDNRYIRESIVPDWPYSQNMALTLTGVNIASMPNASNAFVMELDATWFNYFPYMHNFLFREEWQTNWIRNELSADKVLESFTIGWKLDPDTYERKHFANRVEVLESQGGQFFGEQVQTFDRSGLVTDKWSLLQERFMDVERKRTIYEMEQQHPGVEFDLLPIPGNMKPSNLVAQPKYSKIYTRYINFLQRDALFKGFAIDVEADLIEYDKANNSGYTAAVFQVGKDPDGLPTVIPLHSNLIPRSLRQKWIRQMVRYNHGIKLHFHGYHELRLPQRWTDNLENKKNRVVQDLFERIQAIRDLPQIAQGVEGGDPRAIPVLGAPFILTSNYGVRNHPKTGETHFHNGVDFGAPRGAPLYTPEESKIIKVESDHEFNGNYVVIEGTQTKNRWYFCHMDLMTVEANLLDENGEEVIYPRGWQIGTVGNTGRSTGPHLHLTIYPGGGTAHANPLPYLDQILVDIQEDNLELIAPTPSGSTSPWFDYESTPQEFVTLENEDQLIEVARKEAQSDLELTEEELNALQELLEVLSSEGWQYYDSDTTVTNVWKKMFSMEVKHSGLDQVIGRGEIPEPFRHEGVVLTSVSGGLSHLVAHIPILGHEFPTHQHLGSIEPEYQLEFAILDDQSNLEGISTMGQLIQGMRSMLQSNSRKFRPVMDGWCLAADTFITRFLGTYNENDLRGLEEDGLLRDIDLRKRAVISRTYDGTVPGNPGLSTLQMNLQETNPYQQEVLVSTAPVLQDKEESRRQVLNAVYRLMLIPDYKELLFPIFLAQRLKTNLSDPNSPDFGQFTLRTVSSPLTGYTMNSPDVFLYEGGGQTSLLIRQNDPHDLEFLRSLGLEADYYYDENTLSRTDFIQLNPNEMDTVASSVQTENTFNAGPALDAFFGDNGKLGDLDSGINLWSLHATGSALRAEVADELAYSSQTVYNVGQFVRENPILAQMPVQKLLEYYVGISAVIATGNRMFSEVEVGGLDPAYYFNELYGLPFKPDMWKSWQMFLEEWIKTANPDLVSTALQEFRGNAGIKTWQEPLSESVRPQFAEIASGFYGVGGSPTAVLWNDFGGLNLGPWIRGVQAAYSDNVDVTQGYRDKHEDAIWRLVAQYMRSFPLSVSLPQNLKFQYASIIGDLIGGVSILGDASTNERGKTPTFDSMHDALYQNAFSVGNITYDFISTLNGANPIWQTAAVNNSAREHGGLFGANSLLTSGADLNPVTGSLFYLATGKTITQYAADSWPSAKETGSALGVGETLNDLYTDSPVGAPINSPFEYPVDQGVEQVKVHYIKTILAAMADDMLGDYRLLQMLGLEHLMFRDENRDFVGKDCYPDLELPAHPYYLSTTHSYPDFYMWNIYEDGGALQAEQLNAIQEKVNFVVENAYESMQRLSKGDGYDERVDTLIPEVSVDSPLTLVTQLTPEGTDAQRDGSGAMADPYAPDVSRDGRDTKHSKEVEKWKQDAADGGFVPNIHSSQPADYLDGIRLSNTEGLFGVGGGVHYPRRVNRGTYDQLKQQYLSVNQMFGSSEGYMNRALDERNAPEIARALEGTNLARPPKTNHTFDVSNLKQLSKDSAKDLISQKMSLKRAFPTFKLYFVEEDEFETRFINFDDFYSYNAVKEISITQSRKNASDVAVITLQNISGSLDGTRRNAIVDLDYFTDPTVKTSAAQKLEANEDGQSSVISGDAVTTGTQSEQPFGSVVLRPGLNVQLRMGFSNDPNSLHVMLNGRIVDVVWNKTGDLAEILVQSFGSELEQVVKGTSRDGNSRTFYTTHELLGSMMLEPEVVHFGRWEFGQQFQIGEAKDHKLDFTEYAREGWLGRFTVTSWFSQFVMNHPYVVFGGAAALTAAGLFPYGRAFQFAGKVPGMAGVAGKLSKNLPVGKNGYRAMSEAAGAVDGVIDTGIGTLDTVVGREAAEAALKAKLTAMGAKAAKTIGSVEYETLQRIKFAEFWGDMATASNLDDMAGAAAKLESFIQTSIFKSKWMAKPWVELTGATFASAVGWRPLGQVTNLLLGMPLKAGAAAFLGTVSVDLIIQNIMRPLYRYTVGATQKFFARTRAQLFLTPQDDNLFPPHPKDYMTLDEGIWRQHVDLALHVASMLAFADNDPAITASRFIYPDRAISKKINPDDCHYQLVNTTIWDVFREMSIRHPGWIYAARPYGNQFRYTMFFGVPSQRYWARGASNAFIQRANDLKRFLDNSADEFGDGSGNLISEFEFEALYGAEVLESMREEIQSARIEIPGESIPTFADRVGLPSNNFYLSKGNEDLFQKQPRPLEVVAPDENLIREQREIAVLRGRMTAIAMQEYLRAVQIRFEPFRRYHMLSSERDIVWNGIMGSENAVVNAVDVTYFPAGSSPKERSDEFNTQIKTAVFKAHSFIPEHKLRMAPVRWYNCTGYGMAMRYAMGELVDRMKDMYRGEIIVLGNPRIRPWDVGIVLDTYNQMVGPIEVDQVVHTLSHETGFLTEIKPAALVYANEISGWPMIEAMKLYALAVQDIHNRFAGIKAADTGDGLTSLANVANILSLPSIASPRARDRYNGFIDEKYKKLFGTEGATLDDVYGAEPPPNLQMVDELVDAIYKNAEYGTSMTTLFGLGATLSGSVAGLGHFAARKLDTDLSGLRGLATGTALATDNSQNIIKMFAKRPMGLAAGGALLSGLALIGGAQFTSLVLKQVDFPGMAFLLGSTSLFLQCLRNDAIIVVPLTKDGNPIVSGLALNDPQMLWKSFRGKLNRWAEETITGTGNMLDLYKRYGSEIWERVTEQDLGQSADSAFQSFRPGQVGVSTNSSIIDGLTGE